MAKKNLHSLMSGIIGDNKSQESQPSNAQPTQQPNTPTVPKRGRPKKENNDTRTTLIISSELLRKVKYVSLMEDTTLKEVVDEALSLYVENWEKENIPIRLPKK